MKTTIRLSILCSLFLFLLLGILSTMQLHFGNETVAYAGEPPVLDKFVYLPIVVKPKDPVHKIVFSSNRTDNGNYDIFVIDVDGDNIVNLTNTPDVNESGPLWSPDGTKILYLSGEEYDQEIYVMNRNGSNKINVSNNSSSDNNSPVWSPDSSKVGFRSDRIASGVYDLYVVDANGTGMVNLTNSTNRDEWSLDWSPDGSKIVYVADDNVGLSFDTVIMTMNADGSNKQALETDRSANRFPKWGPNSGKITFAISNECLGMMDSNGANYQPCFTNTPQLESVSIPFQWNPGGSQLFFTGMIAGTFTERWYIFTQATAQSVELDPVEISSFSLSDWSPNGTQLIGARSGEFGAGAYIFVVNPDGTGFSQLTDKGETLDYYDRSPKWSPVMIQ